MRKAPLIVITAMTLALAGCDQPDPNREGTETPVQNPPVDADPTPDTGTGGESQTNAPDASTNGAPAANQDAGGQN